jgi:hypothetical protein
MEGATNHRLAIATLLLLLFLLMYLPPPATGNATIVNESTFPWLVKGNYANYTATGAPDFITPNGTVLLNIKPPDSPNLPNPTGNATLQWAVLNRTASTAWLDISFHTAGCLYSQYEYVNHTRCTGFDYSNNVDAQVNISSQETYVDGSPQGILNFWSAPLLDAGTAFSGTAFVGGTEENVVANVSGPSTTSAHGLLFPLSEQGVNVSGVRDEGPFSFYTLTPTTLGTGSNQTIAWLRVSGVKYGSSVFPEFGPSGIYDYFNGLALEFSLPEFPISQVVCAIQNNQPVNCRYTTYSTTLGQFFRAGSAEMALSSTNVSLNPSQTRSQPGIGYLVYLLYVVPGVLIVAGIALMIRWARKAGRQLTSR